MTNRKPLRRLRGAAGVIAVLVVGLYPAMAMAMVTGPLANKIAHVIAIIVLLFVPIAAIYLFWKVHVLPEVVAEKRHHPQKDAIKALCILSLFFGGLLWPLAWLWAYSKPVMYKLAYGTDKPEDYVPPAETGQPSAAEQVAKLRGDLERLKAAGLGDDELAGVQRELAKLEKRLTSGDAEERS